MRTRFVKIKRYIMTKGTFALIIVLFVISLGAYCILSSNKIIPNALLNRIILNSLLVITSITGTNILTSLILETSNKNQEWRRIISKDVLSNSFFYSNMDHKTKWDIFYAIKCSINGDNDVMIQDDIMSSIIKKLKFENERFYFEKCAYDVKCRIMNDYVEYKVSRITQLYSYQKQFICKKFRVAIVADVCDNEIGIKDISVRLNGRQLSEDDLIIEKRAMVQEADIQRNGYNEIRCIYLKEPLKLFPKDEDKSVTMVYSYTARALLNDLVCSYRASKPCRHFSVKFELLTKDNYQLVTNTFGFLDSSKAEDDTNNDYTSYSEFKDWIFEDDGVVISIVPRLRNNLDTSALREE